MLCSGMDAAECVPRSGGVLAPLDLVDVYLMLKSSVWVASSDQVATCPFSVREVLS